MARIDRLAATAAGSADDDEAVEAREGEGTVARASEEKRLADPAEQQRILMQPDKIEYTLNLTDSAMNDFTVRSNPDPKMRAPLPGWTRDTDAAGTAIWSKAITIPLQLSHYQAFRRRVLDMLESFSKTFMLELSKFTPDGRFPSNEWMTRNPSYMDAACTKPVLRGLAREIVAVLSETSLPEIEEGMDGTGLFAITLSVLNATREEIDGRKKGQPAPAAAAPGPKSGSPRSAPRSPTTSVSNRRK